MIPMAFLVMLVVFPGCAPGTESNNGGLPPVNTPEVKLELDSLSATSSNIIFTWKDPTDPNFDHLEVKYNAYSEDIASGTETCTLSGLTPDTLYKVSLTGMDSLNNLRETVTFFVRTASLGLITFTIISNTIGLDNVRTNLGGNYLLRVDLDLSTNISWIPIGDVTTQFTGILNGNGHTISNLSINSLSDFQGLFGFISGGAISGLGLVNVTISGGQYTGGLAGRMDNAIISDSFSAGEVNGTSRVGGLVGYNNSSSTISDCYSTGTVAGVADYIGGLIGYHSSGCIITGCHSDSLTSGNYYIGGLVGRSASTVTNSYATGTVTGYSDVGGLVGYNYSCITVDCYASGAVSATSDYAGGLVGYNNNASAITFCYATGTVTGSADFVGGLVGYNYNASIVNNSHATGNVSGIEHVGGLVGNSISGTIADCYAGGEVNGYTNVGGLAGYVYTSTLINCYTTNSVCGSANNIGGLVGYSESGCLLSNCYSSGAVRGTNSVGGLVGYNYDGSTITGCHTTGAVSGSTNVGGLCGANSDYITNCYATGNITGSYQVGGLIGYTQDSTIAFSYATGTVLGNRYAGGLIGYNFYGTASNCFSKGAVSGVYYIGGLLGYVYWGLVSKSYSTGAVAGSSYTGGLVGESNNGIISGSFYDKTTSGMTDTGKGTPQITSVMKTETTYTSAGWDFTGETVNGTLDIWSMDSAINSGYPYLTRLAGSY